jgi:sucrose phosphorylase
MGTTARDSVQNETPVAIASDVAIGRSFCEDYSHCVLARFAALRAVAGLFLRNCAGRVERQMSHSNDRFDRVVHESQLRLYLPEPDYTRPVLEISAEQAQLVKDDLQILYGQQAAEDSLVEIERILQVFYAHKTPEMIEDDAKFDPAERFSEKDVILITYGDLLKDEEKAPLRALVDVLQDDNTRPFAISTIHLLPFYPYSSDRGFSVIDYEDVDPHLGTWEEIEDLSMKYRLMFDGVFNHISSKSRWFQEFLNGNPRYQDYFIRFSTRQAIPQDYLNLILRPRTSDLLTGFDTIRGRQYVWSTFSHDQIDLNYHNPEVLIRIIEILLYYVRRGADIIRLDAVTYMWHELGSRCALMDESHVLVHLMRAILDIVAPQVALITETNVPHDENLRYFGDGTNQAQMVYNFALPPMTLHTFQTGDCRKLTRWAATLEHVSDAATYFNFLDSHDGVGLLPVQGILEPSEIETMIEKARENGALISYRGNPEGGRSPYEINTTWFSALNREDSDEPLSTQVNRFIASRAVALVLKGVPGIYLPSLVGTRNDTEAIVTGQDARSINRGTIDIQMIRKKSENPDSLTSRIFVRFGELIRLRTQSKAFHPNATQEILDLCPSVFSVLRRSCDEREVILALINVSNLKREVRIPLRQLAGLSVSWRDLIGGQVQKVEREGLVVLLDPYQVRWLRPDVR